MTPKSRTRSGVALMLVLIPIFAGLLACMPVPIGDPERSRIDPELTGVWAILSGSATVDESIFYIFEPYDKRTWLVTGASLAEGDGSDLSKYDLTSYDGFVQLAATEPVDENHVRVNGIVVSKAWLKKLGGGVFMTWEPKIMLDDGIPEPEVWFVYRVIKDGPDKFRMQMVDSDSDLFDDIKETRRAFEKVISKNVDNPDLYADSQDESSETGATLVRVQDSEMDFFEKLVSSFVDW